MGGALGLPDEIIKRHPIPGPALAIRILGEVSHEKLNCLRDADWIVRDEIKKQVFIMIYGNHLQFFCL